LKPERWEVIKQLFDSALEQEPDRRTEFLQKACAGDESLRAEVEAMLARHAESPDFLESPAMHAEALALAKEFETKIIGSTLGHYRIDKQLGRGGMGEVYLAKDLSLNRKVALKFLPDIFSVDPERMARFEREARLLASLNHPNIGAIHGLEQTGEKRFLILELVEGETLAHRLSKGPLPLDDTLGIFRQIAEALEAAHEKGIIHRDLKPANVMITAEGRVKLLDFGLAKALWSEPQNTDLSKSPTITATMTLPGVVLGTAAYMSPEQAKGKAVDRRADIWALGCILYECLTGKRAFKGETVTETLAAILKCDPDWQALPSMIPANIYFVLGRCLEKDLSRRFRDAADVQIQLEEERGPGETVKIAATTKRLWLAWAVAGVFILAFSALSFIHFRERPLVQSRMVQFQIKPPDAVKPSVYGKFAISPDGRWLAFSAAGSDGATRIWIRALDSLEARPLPGTESSWFSFFWSPDSRFIAFDAEGKLKKINVSGGPPQEICVLTAPLVGGSWNLDGVIIFGQSEGGLMRVSSGGGVPSPLTELNRNRLDVMHMHPVFLPDGRHFLYLCLSGKSENQGIYLGCLDTRPENQQYKRIVASNARPQYVPSQTSNEGRLLFMLESTLMAQRFDDRRLELVGELLPVAEQVGSVAEFGFFSASTNGVLVYRGVANFTTQLGWFDRQGKALGPIGETDAYFRVALSPNGTRAAVSSRQEINFTSDIWLIDLRRGTRTRFTFGKGDSMRPVWSPDGNQIAFSGNIDGGGINLYQKPVRGSNQEELLLKSSESKFATNWSSDGRFLLYTAFNQKTKNDLYALPLQVGAQGYPLLNSEFNEEDGHFSPDMRWIAYVSNKSGRNEVYIQRFSPGASGSLAAVNEELMVSVGSGKGPRWRGDGRELYYRAPNGAVMAVDIAAGATLQAGPPRTLFQALPSDVVTSGSFAAFPVWDVTRDGNRFLLAIPTPETSPSPFTIILNWMALLKK
jgi:serine/threonine protein kinase/Tol biopolymer transport system component